MSFLDLFRPKEKFRASIRFRDEIDAVSAADQLRLQNFTVSLIPPSQAGGTWEGLAEITLDGKSLTKERVRRYLDILLRGYDGEYREN